MLLILGLLCCLSPTSVALTFSWADCITYSRSTGNPYIAAPSCCPGSFGCSVTQVRECREVPTCFQCTAQALSLPKKPLQDCEGDGAGGVLEVPQCGHAGGKSNEL